MALLDNLSELYSIDGQMFRSSQPSQRQLKSLKKIGVKTIINLRGKWLTAYKFEKEACDRIG